MLGGERTFSVSLPVLPVPPLVDVTLPVVFAFAPLVVAVIDTLTVQVPLAAIVPPEKVRDVFPAVGATSAAANAKLKTKPFRKLIPYQYIIFPSLEQTRDKSLARARSSGWVSGSGPMAYRRFGSRGI
jgi:hypothetical protein